MSSHCSAFIGRRLLRRVCNRTATYVLPVLLKLHTLPEGHRQPENRHHCAMSAMKSGLYRSAVLDYPARMSPENHASSSLGQTVPQPTPTIPELGTGPATTAEVLQVLLAARITLQSFKLQNGNTDPKIAAWVAMFDSRINERTPGFSDWGADMDTLSGRFDDETYDLSEVLGLIPLAVGPAVLAAGGAFTMTELAGITMAALAAVAGIHMATNVPTIVQPNVETAPDLLVRALSRASTKVEPVQTSPEAPNPSQKRHYKKKLAVATGLLGTGLLMTTEYGRKVLKCWDVAIPFAIGGVVLGKIL